jgi:hypothetical protein
MKSVKFFRTPEMELLAQVGEGCVLTDQINILELLSDMTEESSYLFQVWAKTSKMNVPFDGWDIPVSYFAAYSSKTRNAELEKLIAEWVKFKTLQEFQYSIQETDGVFSAYCYGNNGYIHLGDFNTLSDLRFYIWGV